MSVIVPDSAPIPNTYTPVSVYGALLIQAMAPWMTLHLAWLCDAVGVMVDPYWLTVSDTGVDGDANYLPGYGQLFNIQPAVGQAGYGAATCPAVDLGYAAQFVGASIPTGTDAVTARSLVMAEAGLNRGTPSAVIAAAKRNLSATQSVAYIERRYVDGTPNAGWFGLVVRPEELTSLSAFTAAINATKFGGLMWWLVQSDAFTWAGAIHAWSADTMTWDQTTYIQP